MGTVAELNALTLPAIDDLLLVRDISDAIDKDKRMRLDALPMKAVANTFSALNTFSAGVNLGNETINIFRRTNFAPGFTTQGSTTFTYTSQLGEYLRIGNSASGQSVVIFGLTLSISAIATAVASAVRITLPVPVAGTPTICTLQISGPNVAGTPMSMSFETEVGQSYGVCRLVNDVTGISNLLYTELAAVSLLRVSGFYFA